MRSICFKIIAKFIKWVNNLTVNVVKFTNFIANWIFLFLVLIIAICYFFDKTYAESYYSEYIVNYLITNGYMYVFFSLSHFVKQNFILSRLIFIGVILSIYYLKKLFRVNWTKNKYKYNLVSNISFCIVNIIFNFFILASATVFILNFMITSYVNYAYDDYEDTMIVLNYMDKVNFIKEQISENSYIASIALNKIIFDIENDDKFLLEMDLEEKINFCNEVNFLIDRQNGPKSAKEHYLRNYLNYMPLSLDLMISEIKKGNNLGWGIMEPKSSVFHMFGHDGEYNVKFVSENGFFEAVYNKKGILLSDKNDPINMGTYNYACPNTNSRKHSTYDVASYYRWGNTENSKFSITTNVLNNLESYYNNEDAIVRFEMLKALINKLPSK